VRFIGNGSHRRLGPAILALLLAGLLLMQCCAMAAEADTGVIRISYKDGSYPLAGVKFSIYHVAERVAEHVYAPTGDFAECPVENTDDLDSDELRMLTDTLTGHILKKSLKPAATATTDANGDCAFTGLADGLYLITGAPYSNGKTSWFCEASLVGMPERFGARDFTIEAKSEQRDDEKIDIKVMKVWKNDDDHKETRTNKVDVQLFCNGNLYDTATLNKSNNWRYTWVGLDGLAEWHVVETTKVKDYVTKITRNEYEFVITNTYEEEGPPPDEKLPQTGLLWWPVPVLMAAGIVLFAAGLIRRRNGE